MNSLFNKLKEILVNDKTLNFVAATFWGLIGFLLVKDFLTPLLLAGKDFAALNLFIKLLLFIVYFGSFVLLYFLILWVFKWLKSFKKTVKVKNESIIQNVRSPKAIIMGLLIFAFGVLLIYIFNNLISRIDTENWRLTGLDIIPVMEPIGNDFRVGLYWPAENLVKSGFKAIGPDGTYPSVWPPLVSVLSLFYLLFNAQTAYLVHTAFLVVLNIFVLLIATILVSEFLLEKVIQDKFTRNILSILLFITMAFYNFSSYSFLFSIERGNVDVIPMFFMMLSMWTLLKQPKNIWLQVIFLSIATHYKIYPAVLFLVLLYYHGKKLILPMLVVNVAFLFVLGPKIAFAFINSVTSGGSGAGFGNQWSWIGNHGAYSFAKLIFVNYPSFVSAFSTLFIALMLIPFSIWVQGALRILRDKFTPLNAILLFLISVPLMDLLPTISNDYRLIIESTVFLIYIGLILSQISRNPGWKQIVELILVIIIMFFIAKPYPMASQYSYDIRSTSSFFINNKYLWCLALEGTMVWNIIRHKKQSPAELN